MPPAPARLVPPGAEPLPVVDTPVEPAVAVPVEPAAEPPTEARLQTISAAGAFGAGLLAGLAVRIAWHALTRRGR